jgi:hypothetical protein
MKQKEPKPQKQLSPKPMAKPNQCEAIEMYSDGEERCRKDVYPPNRLCFMHQEDIAT